VLAEGALRLFAPPASTRRPVQARMRTGQEARPIVTKAKLARLKVSALPAEGDLIEDARAEFFGAAGDGLAAKGAVKLDRVVVFR
jgi:hypothetical protein